MKKILLFLCLFSITAHAEGYLCFADKATGFDFDKNRKEWVSTNFNVKENKYTVTQKNGKWVWTEFGKKTIPIIAVLLMSMGISNVHLMDSMI